MTQSDIAPKFHHVMRLEYVLDQAIVFAEVKASLFGGNDPGCVLASMLEDCQSIEDELVDLLIISAPEREREREREMKSTERMSKLEKKSKIKRMTHR